MKQPSQLMGGAGEIVITPPVGAPLVTRPSTGVHDDLFARALVLDDAARRIAIVSLDLTGTDFGFADELRAHIQQRTGIDWVLLCSTHTHSAPFTIPYTVTNWDWFMHAGIPWRNDLMTNITEVVCRANAGLAPVVLRAGREPVQVGVNRRLELHTRSGPGQPGAGDGVVPWVDVLRVDNAHGTPVAILFSHAAHPVTVHHASDLISADYPGYAVGTVRRHFGDTIAMFAQACGGDINGDPLNSGFEAAASAGARLGKAVIKAASESTLLDVSELKTRSARFEVPLCDFLPEATYRQHLGEVESSRTKRPGATPPTAEDGWWSADIALCLRDLLGKKARGERPSLRFEAHALTVEDQWCLLAMPHEIFSEYQRWVETVSPFRLNMTLGCTTACESYIPTDRDLEAGGPEAATFGAPLLYHHRLPPKPGIETLIKDRAAALLSAAGERESVTVGGTPCSG